MPNNINKTIKVNVDTGDLKTLRDLLTQINKLTGSSGGATGRTSSQWTAQLKAAEAKATAATQQIQSRGQLIQSVASGTFSARQQYQSLYAERMQSMQQQYQKAYARMKTGAAGAGGYKGYLAAKEVVGTLGKEITAAQVTNGLIIAGDKLLTGAQALTKTVTGMSLSLKDTFKSILSNAGSILDLYTGAATYSTGTSLITNRRARQLQLQYGLTGSQAYGLQTAGSLLGMNVTSMEDFAYMNPAQRELFTQYLQKYTAWHDKMEQSGMLSSIQQMQLDFATFKQEIAADFLSWVAQNKEVILSTLKGLVELIKGTVIVLGKIMTLFGVKYDTASLAGDTSTVYNGAKSVTATMNVNMSGVADQTEMRAAMKEYMNEFASDLAIQLG